MNTSSSLRFLAASAMAAVLFLTSSCCTPKPSDGGKGTGQTGNNPPPPSALCMLQDDNGNPIPASFTGTLGTTHQGHAANHVNQILSVQHACCAGFDRLIFAVDGIHEPTYTIQYASAPFSDCGSGNTHHIPGDAFLAIKMTPAQGHGNGQATLPRDTLYSCPNLKHLAITCDFESDLTFVVGLKSKKPYRVIELQNPSTRLIVDIKH
jgi:hypothetical protein